MSDNLSDYQSSDTAWRYDSQISQVEATIEKLKNSLIEAEKHLSYLEAHPPLYEYFNWSA